MARVGIYIEPNEYAEFGRLAPQDAHFMVSYREWLRRESAAPRQVMVSVREFSAYCLQIAATPSFEALAALAERKAREEHP